MLHRITNLQCIACLVVKTELLWVSKAIVQAANDGNQVINISVGSYIILDKNDHQTFRKDEK